MIRASIQINAQRIMRVYSSHRSVYWTTLFLERGYCYSMLKKQNWVSVRDPIFSPIAWITPAILNVKANIFFTSPNDNITK